MVVRSGFNCRRPGSVKTHSQAGAPSHIVKPEGAYTGEYVAMFDSRPALHYETSVRIVRLVAAHPG